MLEHSCPTSDKSFIIYGYACEAQDYADMIMSTFINYTVRTLNLFVLREFFFCTQQQKQAYVNMNVDQLKRFRVTILDYFPAAGYDDFITANSI